ncbi:hypothetical protein BMS84_06655 [Leuconostoc pseudomesenteroides]|nr:hypothetical protein BMS84_06655 [Leuconostoc pseudomesenteroides]
MDYVNQVKEALNNRWIDVAENVCLLYTLKKKAKLYNTHVHSQNTIAALRGYHSARSQQLAQNNIPEALYDVLISKTHEHINTVYRYYDLRKKVLGVEQLHHYDLSVPLTGKDFLPTTYEEGEKLALEALKPLGEDYVNQVKEALNNRWIDVAENVGKSSGGFEIGIATVHPYILLTWTNKLYSTNILVHELGHAIHSVRSNQTQPVQYSISYQQPMKRGKSWH